MDKTKLKYTINDQIDLLPRHITIGKLEQILLSEHGITRDAFYRDRNLTVKDEFSIPSDRMDVYAGLFGISVAELKNYPTKKIKPLTERKQSALAKKVIKKGKLIKGSNSKS